MNFRLENDNLGKIRRKKQKRMNKNNLKGKFDKSGGNKENNNK